MESLLSVSAGPKDTFALFATRVALAISLSPDNPSVAQEVKCLLRKALSDEVFVVDCVERAASAMRPLLVNWTNPPIIDEDELAFSIRLIYWPALSANSPHEHTFWTVTGVLSNELTFVTYRRSTNSGQLTIDREIHGRRGEVGCILPPCIHQVRNHSTSPSISIHIFTGPKKEAGEYAATYERGRTTWYGGEHGKSTSRPLNTADVFQALVSLLDSIGCARSLEIIDRLFDLCDLQTKLACVKAISRQDPGRASHRLLEVAAKCRAEDATRLRILAAGLLLGELSN